MPKRLRKSFYLSFLNTVSIINCLIIYVCMQTFQTSQPKWLTSPFFRANNEAVLSTLTGSNATPQYTFTFSSALPGLPNLAYGIKGYRGDDYMGQEYFQIRRQNLTTSTFGVSIQIFGITNLYILNVAYVAIDPTFPHHLNSFDNVPLNYSSGPITNITILSADKTFFTEIIHYSIQAADRTFKQFKQPLSGNKILMFITSLFINANFHTATQDFPVQIEISYQIIDSQYYSWTTSVWDFTSITRLHFSEIIFDSIDILASFKYYLQYQIWETPVTGGFKQIPIQFIDNFIMGLTDWKMIDGQCAIWYSWNFDTQGNTTFGVLIEPSNPINAYNCGMNITRSTIFYMKTWKCDPPYPYFNLSSNLCQDKCGDYFFQNIADSYCAQCHYSCKGCNSTDASSCLVCDQRNDRRILTTLANGSLSCECMPGLFDTLFDSKCLTCLEYLDYCADCQKNSFGESNISQLIVCTKCITGAFLNPQNSNCQLYKTCESLFLNLKKNKCEQCNIPNCIQCASYYHCASCNQSSDFFQGDQEIQSFNASNYAHQMQIQALSQEKRISQCKKCVLQGCLKCLDLSRCQACNQSAQYQLSNITFICIKVEASDQLATAVLTVSSMSLGFMFLVKNSLPTLQIISSLQIAYISLSTLQNLHPIAGSLLLIKPITGFNSPEWKFPSSSNPQAVSSEQVDSQKVKRMDYQSSFFLNNNIMFIIQTCGLLLLGILYLLKRKLHNQKLESFYKFFQKQTFLVVLFSSINLFFSIPLVITAYAFQIVVISLQLLYFIGQIAHTLYYYVDYNGFDTTFKELEESQRCRIFLIIYCLVRITIVLICSFCRNIQSSQYTFAIVIIQLFACIFFTYLRPYTHPQLNFLTLAAEYLLLSFLIINQIVRFLEQSNTTLKQTTEGVAWLQLFICIFIGILGLSSILIAVYYDWYKFIKQKCASSAVANQESIIPQNSTQQYQRQKQSEYYQKTGENRQNTDERIVQIYPYKNSTDLNQKMQTQNQVAGQIQDNIIFLE